MEQTEKTVTAPTVIPSLSFEFALSEDRSTVIVRKGTVAKEMRIPVDGFLRYADGLKQWLADNQPSR